MLNINRRIEYHRAYQDTAYLKLVQKILNEGFQVLDRTGTGTIGINGYQAEYDLSRHAQYTENGVLIVDNFPLLTTKRMFLKGIIEELLWLLRGETNIKYLVNNGVNIWNDWPLKAYNQSIKNNNFDGQDRQMTMEEFIKNIKIDVEFAAMYGELGPVYGEQWRNWKAPDGRRIDQLALMVDQLKNNKFSRRIIVNAWNPADIEEMAKSGLPPCHMEFQAFVRPNPEEAEYPYLDLQMYQRSDYERLH
jgi:thymidylate synthase